MKNLLPLVVIALVAPYTPSFAQLAHSQPVSAAAEAAGYSTAGPASGYGKLPLSFEPNAGQADPQVRFLARGNGYSLFLTDSSAVLALSKRDSPAKGAITARHAAAKTDVVRMELAGASSHPSVTGTSKLPGIANYFVGSDPAKWHSNLPTYSKVKYSGVYPGVDLVYYGNQRQLEYDFIVAPNVDPAPVKLHFAGASRLTIDAKGDLVIGASNGEIAFHKPVVYQLKDGQRELIPGRFALLAKNTVGFRLGSYDRSRELVIDPQLAYSTYLGGKSADGAGIAVDASGSAYITGTSMSPFPISSYAFQVAPPANELYNAIVSKLNPAGTSLDYSTYLSGDDGNESGGSAIAVDKFGDAYVMGATFSYTFPTTANAFQKTNHSTNFYGTDFITKLNPYGSGLLYSSYLGGSSGEGDFCGLALDESGNAYVIGATLSSDFPTTTGAFQRTSNTQGAATSFVTKIDSSGSSLLYSTFLIGTIDSRASDFAEGIAVDQAGHAYVVGEANTPDFPTTPGAFQTSGHASNGSGFVTKFKADGSGLIYSTLLNGAAELNGGTAGSQIRGIALDNAGEAYVTGATKALDFPVTDAAFQRTSTSGLSAFITKFNAQGSGLVYSTYLSGKRPLWEGQDQPFYWPYGIALDQAGHAFVTGGTFATDFPTTAGAFQTVNRAHLNANHAGSNAFFTELSLDGSSLLYSTYLGGTSACCDYDTGVAVDKLSNVYLVGYSSSHDFPVTDGAFQSKTSAESAVVSKFAFVGATTTVVAASASPAVLGSAITFTATTRAVDGGPIPTGSVSFYIGGEIGHVALDETGNASYASNNLKLGDQTIVASYQGDITAYSASSGTVNVTVDGGKVATPTFSPRGGTYATGSGSMPPVTISSLTAGATIHYTTDGSMPTSSSPKYSSPVPVSTTTTLKAIALANGDSASDVGTANITLAPTAKYTTTAVKLSANPAKAGQANTFTAVVSAPGSAVPTGTVVFLHGGVVMGTATLDQKKTATLTTSALSEPGSYSITAQFTGNPTWGSSTSPAIIQIVNE